MVYTKNKKKINKKIYNKTNTLKKKNISGGRFTTIDDTIKFISDNPELSQAEFNKIHIPQDNSCFFRSVLYQLLYTNNKKFFESIENNNKYIRTGNYELFISKIIRESQDEKIDYLDSISFNELSSQDREILL